MSETRRVILAADGLPLARCFEILDKIGNRLFAVKIHDLLDREGPSVIKALKSTGARAVWADVKLTDISNTVGLRTKALVDAGADFVSVMANAEVDAMTAARAYTAGVVAATIPTSLDEEQAHLMYGQPSKAGALYLARLAVLANVQIVVSSPKEVTTLVKRAELKGRIRFWTPGIRPAGKDPGDQKRFDTPGAAIKAGADKLIIGRALTEAASIIDAMTQIEEEVEAALTA